MTSRGEYVRYATVCSGIEAPSVAWEPLGWEPQWFSEIDPFCCSLLSHYWPSVPNHGDMTKLHEQRLADIDVLCGGTPCQSFSVAGLRGGLADPRGNLALVYCRLVERIRPRWVIWENVCGALSIDGGRALGALIWTLEKLGYCVAWRVLDAQYFGLAQRRKRVFLVGSLGDFGAAAVLLEPESLRGDSAPSRQTRQDVAGTLSAPSTAGGGLGSDFEMSGGVVADPITANEGRTYTHEGRTYTHEGRNNFRLHNVIAFDTTQITSPTNRTRDLSKSPAMTQTGHPPSVAFTERSRADGRTLESQDELAYAPTNPGSGGRAHSRSIIDPQQMVRRLTPRECERLQGYHDDYTLIEHNGKPSSDSARYRALGNSIAVPVLRWIGQRIQMVGEA